MESNSLRILYHRKTQAHKRNFLSPKLQLKKPTQLANNIIIQLKLVDRNTIYPNYLVFRMEFFPVQIFAFFFNHLQQQQPHLTIPVLQFD